MTIENIDLAKQIHYGVISQNEILRWWADWSEEVYTDETGVMDYSEDVEPIGRKFESKEYTAFTVLDSDVMVSMSPYYTYCRPCSPCVPNAGDLNSPGGLLKTYCFGHECFEDRAPYTVYDVKTGDIVPYGGRRK